MAIDISSLDSNGSTIVRDRSFNVNFSGSSIGNVSVGENVTVFGGHQINQRFPAPPGAPQPQPQPQQPNQPSRMQPSRTPSQNGELPNKGCRRAKI